MTRPRLGLRYGDQKQAKAPEGSIDPETPIPGFYRYRLRSGGAAVGVEIRMGPPLDPVTGEELDRGHRLQAFINGKFVEMEEVWPKCGGEPISREDHDHLVRLQRWGAENGHEALADPRKKLDNMTTPMMF